MAETYTVRRGDTLRAIASRYGLTWQEVYEANKDVVGGNPNLIRPGQTFTIPGTGGGDDGGGSSNTRDAGGGVTTAEGTPSQENQASKGEGHTDDDPDTPDLTILTSDERKFYFDKSSGLWYVEYGLPGSDRKILFEATPEQMDSIYGKNFRPDEYQTVGDIDKILKKPGYHFTGDITEMSGTGDFETLFRDAVNKGLDDGTLPEWAAEDPEILDLVFIAHTEGKSDEWMIEQVSQTQSFKKRFPGIQTFREQGGLTLGDAITGFLEMESQMKTLAKSYGLDPEQVTAGKVGNVLTQGYSVAEVTDSYRVWDRMRKNKPALDAFNQVLAANGQKPMKANEMIKFLRGQAPKEVYDIYEAASFTESADALGVSQYLDAETAMEYAAYTEGSASRDNIMQSLQGAAQNILRYRGEIDTATYGLDAEDLIDLSLGMPLRSGNDAAEVMQNMERASLEAQANRQAQGARAFSTFTGDGRQTQRGVSTGRATY